MAFSFAFSGDDIDAHEPDGAPPAEPRARGPAPAFPVPGRPQLPPTDHDLAHLLARLPSKIAYSCLDAALDSGSGPGSGSSIRIPRRELWDVRVQLMAEDDGHGAPGSEALGDHDVKTGIYEGGFKSWESSVDLVKVLAAESHPLSLRGRPLRIIELGCGTALPSLALFQWALALEPEPSRTPLTFVLADYNPSVLQLVTLPNFLLAWALLHQHRHPALEDAFSLDGELQLTPPLLQAFQTHLVDRDISLFFLSGGWSPEFVQLLYDLPRPAPDASASASAPAATLLLGAETIYSPFALQAFTDTVLAILDREETVVGADAAAFVAAKRLYFGVGGSLDDFIDKAQARGARVTTVREETEGVRRSVVRCAMPGQSHEVAAQATAR